MENQHKLITGYRDLSQEDIDLINEGKALEKQIAEYFLKVARNPGADIKAACIGREQIMAGFMWLFRATAKPENPWTASKIEGGISS